MFYKKDIHHKSQNFNVIDEIPSGFSYIFEPSEFVHSGFFNPEKTNTLYSFYNLSNISDINFEKKKKEIQTQLVNLGEGPTFENVSENMKDNSNWLPSLGKGFMSLEKIEKKIKGLTTYVLIINCSLPILSLQFYTYLKKHVDDKKINFETFYHHDKYYQKFISLCKRNSDLLAFQVLSLCGIEFKSTTDIDTYLKDEFSFYNFMAVPSHYRWLNKLEKLFIDNKYVYGYNNGCFFNLNYVIGNNENFLKEIKFCSRKKIEDSNNVSNIIPFFSGFSNKMIISLVPQNETSLLLDCSGKELSSSIKKENYKHSLGNIKGIEKIFINLKDKVDINKFQIYSNYTDIKNNGWKKIYCEPVLRIY